MPVRKLLNHRWEVQKVISSAMDNIYIYSSTQTINLKKGVHTILLSAVALKHPWAVPLIRLGQYNLCISSNTIYLLPGNTKFIFHRSTRYILKQFTNSTINSFQAVQKYFLFF